MFEKPCKKIINIERIKLSKVSSLILFLSFLHKQIAAKKIKVKTPRSPREDNSIVKNELSGLRLGLNQPLNNIKELKKLQTKNAI